MSLGIRRYRHVQQHYENICAQNNTNLFDFHMPMAAASRCWNECFWPDADDLRIAEVISYPG
jgi:hypothetical protein